MAPLRSLGNALSSFRDFYASTGTDAIGAPPDGSSPISVTGGNTNYTYNGKKIHVWTINDEDTMQKLIDLGVDGIITDRPKVLKDLLSNR